MSLPSASRRAGPGIRRAIASAAILILLAAMAIDTKVVKVDAPVGAQRAVFTASEYGRSEFPKVQSLIVNRAVDAAALASAIAKDPVAAAKEYGVETGAGPEIPVKFTGVVGQEDSGVYDVTVDGVPGTVRIRVQTGPAIMGTDLRDATGTIDFGQFTNQIDYQNAGSALNKAMKNEVLSKIDTGQLTGKIVSVVGVFQLTSPDSWLVTPVKLEAP